jgi:hypothetical protein
VQGSANERVFTHPVRHQTRSRGPLDPHRECHDFYAATRATLEAAWLRPRHDGYIGVSTGGIDDAILLRAPAAATIAALNELSNSFDLDTLRK